MNANAEEPKTRHERLTAIAEEYAEEIHDPRTERQLSRLEPVSRYAAVTSEGSIESSYASNGSLLVSDSPGELAEQLRGECGEGWLAHGRVWDLDAPWHLWGNLGVTYSVSVGDECPSPAQVVTVAAREDGTYLFEDLLDAETFVTAVRRHGGEARLSEKPLLDHRAAERLIDAERDREEESHEHPDHIVVGDDGEQGRHWIGPFSQAEAERQVEALAQETGLPWELLPAAAD